MDGGALAYGPHAGSAAAACPYTGELVWVCLACGELTPYQLTRDGGEPHDDFMSGIVEGYSFSHGTTKGTTAAVHSPYSGADGTASGALTSSLVSSPATPTPPRRTPARLEDPCLRDTSDSYLSQAASSSHRRHQRHRQQHAAAAGQLIEELPHENAHSDDIVASRDSSSQRHVQHCNTGGVATAPTALQQQKSTSLDQYAVDTASPHRAAPYSQRHSPSTSPSSRQQRRDDAAMHSLTVLLMEEHLIGSREMRFCRHCRDVRCAEIRKLSELPHPDALDGAEVAGCYGASDVAQVSPATRVVGVGSGAAARAVAATASSPAHHHHQQQQQHWDDILSHGYYTALHGEHAGSRHGSFLSATHNTASGRGNWGRGAVDAATAAAAPDAASVLLYDGQDAQPLAAWFGDRAQPPISPPGQRGSVLDRRTGGSEAAAEDAREGGDAAGEHGASENAENSGEPRNRPRRGRGRCEEIPSVHLVVALSLARLYVRVKALAVATTSRGLRLLAPALVAPPSPSPGERLYSDGPSSAGAHLCRAAAASGRGRHTSGCATPAPTPASPSGWLAVFRGVGQSPAAWPHGSAAGCDEADDADGTREATTRSPTRRPSEAFSATSATGRNVRGAAHTRAAPPSAKTATTSRLSCAAAAPSVGTTGSWAGEESNGVSFTSSQQTSYAATAQDQRDHVDAAASADRYRVGVTSNMRLESCDAVSDNAQARGDADPYEELDDEDVYANVGDIDDDLDALANRHGARLGHPCSGVSAAVVQTCKRKWDAVSIGEALWRLVLPSFSAPFSSTPCTPFSPPAAVVYDEETPSSRDDIRRSAEDRRGIQTSTQATSVTTPFATSPLRAPTWASAVRWKRRWVSSTRCSWRWRGCGCSRCLPP